jgi:hypothetical protein
MNRTLSSDRSLLGGGFGLILSIPIEFTWTFSFRLQRPRSRNRMFSSRVSPGFWYSDSRCLQTVWRLFTWALWATFKLIKRGLNSSVFWAEFFLSKNQLLTPEMDFMAKTKDKNNKAIFFFSVKIKSFVSNFFGKTVKYHVSNKRPGSHFYG